MNYPNVSIYVFNALGREVELLLENKEQQQGSYKIKFDAINLYSGIYFFGQGNLALVND